MSGKARHTRSKLPARLPLRAAILAALSAAPALQAATIPPGTALDASEFLANSFTANRQVGAKVARDAAGDFVVVWQSYGEATSTSGFNIYARRFNAAGQAQGSEFLVNTVIGAPSSDPQTLPSVAMDAAGDFVVAWERRENSSAIYDVYARRYSSAGTARDASEFRVNSFTAGKVKNPAVAMDAAGDFVVAYESLDQTGGSSNYYDIYAQRYDSAGVTQGSEFLVNTAITGGLQQAATVAMDAAGDFVVAWENKTTPSGGNYDIYARQYDHTGSALQASEFQVNTYTSLDQRHPTVAMDAAGDFVVAWQSYGQAVPGSITSDSSNDIYARQYNAFGAAQQASEFLVDTTISMRAISSDQSNPAVAMDAAGDFVVTWQHNNFAGGTREDVLARQYTATGSALQASEFLLNTYTSGAQGAPAVAMDAAGDFVAAWQSYTQAASNSQYDIYARRYQGAETVDLAATLAASPASVSTGGKFTLTLGVDNKDAAVSFGNTALDTAVGAASGITASFTVPSGATLDSTSGSNWSCGTVSGGTLSCTYTTSLAASTTASSLTLDFTAPAKTGKISIPVGVSAAVQQSSSDSGGNSTSATVTVNAPSSGGGSSGGGSTGGGTSGGGGSGGGGFGLLSLAFLGLPLFGRRKNRH